MPKSYTPNWFFTALLDNHINQLVARYSRLRALRMDFFYRKDTPDFLQPDHRWLELQLRMLLGRTPFRKPASSDARPSSDDTPLSGGCSETRKASDKKPGEAAVLWIKRGDVEAMQKAMERARYLVKYETKQHDGSGQRNYGCSRGAGRLLDGR